MKKLIILFTGAMALASCGGNGSSNTDSDTEQSNAAPTVDAGVNTTVEERENVTLTGTLVDNEGDATVLWVQVSGDSVDLENSDTLTPSFTAPRTNEDEIIVFRLTADDGENQASDEVSITVNDRNTSSQGIDENSDDRRQNASDNRSNNSIFTDGREVRTYDGSNNNVSNPLWGASFSHLERIADVAYDDLISSLAGPSRLGAREISNAVAHQDAGESIPNNFGTSDFLWQWGQFIDHDIGITDGVDEPADIPVPSGDEFFDPTGTGSVVLSFSRALHDHNTGTSVANPREQENEITAWIDGSMIYGSDDERALGLRVSEDSPYLATSDGNLLPFNSGGLTNANAFGVEDSALFVAGDVRVNEQLGLAVMHTIWVREHNRIAEILEDEFVNADGEDIFQATRRLVVAKIQKITYEEFLPALIGDDAISNYSGYDSSVQPGLFNEFSVAAFRLGHSLVNETLLRLDDDGNTIDEGNLDIKDTFFVAPSILTTRTSTDPILRGMASQLSQTMDTKVISGLRNFLFGMPGAGGLDLVSLNIQRGRDHGIPSYNDMREAMGLDRKDDFSDISSDTEVQSALESVYTSVDDIDLWVGGLSEDALTSEGSQLGEIFREMLILQFEALRDGDRFWYENDLTDDELDRVEDTTLAEVIIDNTSIENNELQRNVFYAD